MLLSTTCCFCFLLQNCKYATKLPGN
uniref:Uncharacterized protein n=1 Tax=Arundo donax TaxID=35708 RepID=A0A0A9HAM6_ARUDO